MTPLEIAERDIERARRFWSRFLNLRTYRPHHMPSRPPKGLDFYMGMKSVSART